MNKYQEDGYIKSEYIFYKSINNRWAVGLIQEFRGRRHRTCWRKSHRSHNQNVVIK